MKEVVSTVASRGQVTIPASVRKHLKVNAGDRIIFMIETGGTVTLSVSRYPNMASLRGAAGSLKQPLNWQEMKQIAHEDQTDISP